MGITKEMDTICFLTVLKSYSYIYFRDKIDRGSLKVNVGSGGGDINEILPDY